ncbi:hemolysin family protein [Photobacterium lipolyticum]|uniref:hemolysin family protein n=1 Tax=Photobacterium lipolyticum TaxID=266810 RepID=UPI0014761C3A|nr:hemolysin family protein [Photobacterium lipolyticum]
MDVSLSLLAVILLLITNGFFVAAEFALVKARSFRLETLADEGSSAAKLTLNIQGNLEAYLAACQLGITMASLGLGWVGEPAVAHLLEPLFLTLGLSGELLHTVSFLIGFLIFSSLHIVLGEQVPKTLAIRSAEPVSLWIAYPLHYSYLLVWPLNWLLNASTSAILRLFGSEQATHADVLSGDELKNQVAKSQEHGEIEHGKARMLSNLFEFDQRLVGRVMIPKGAVKALYINNDPTENLNTIRDAAHSRYPLLDGEYKDSIVGILLTKDLYHALLDGDSAPWEELERFCRPPLIVPQSQKISDLFETMRTEHAHMAFVVDEYGEFEGLVTMEDLLEEIVGEIEDETDTDESIVVLQTLGDNCWEADGLISLSDLERLIGITVPADVDANSLSGLFMYRLKRMPEPGDELTEGEFTLKVESLKERHVGQVLIQRLQDEAPPADNH